MMKRLQWFIAGISLYFAITAPGAELRHFNNLTGKSLIEEKEIAISFSQAPQATVIVFLSILCPCSRSHEAKIESLAKSFPDFHFYAVHANREESKEDCKGRWGGQKGSFKNIIYDPEQRLANLFGALKTPHVFIIDRQGNERYRGAVDNSRMASQATKEFLQTALTELQKGQKLSRVESRPLGCTIER